MAMFGFPHWQLKSTSTESGVVAPDERLPFAQTAVMGVQHAVAMFGATVLMPILMGLDPNLSILMSGIGTSSHIYGIIAIADQLKPQTMAHISIFLSVLKSIIFQALNQIFKSSWIVMVR